MADPQGVEGQRDTTPVKINLGQRRMYRANDDDTVAITVGPGEGIEVPTWVAEHWGLVAPAQSKTGAAANTPPTLPSIPPAAVSATVETVQEQPMQTTETVQTFVTPQTAPIKPVGRDRTRR